jgi:hypothetical protein
MANFIMMGCTQMAGVAKYLDEIKIPENFKNFVPPMINSEIWNNFFPYIQQQDKTQSNKIFSAEPI